MAPTRPIDVQDFMNHHKLSSYQIRIIALCFLIVAIDGFDTAAIGFIAPALRAEWGVTAAQLAPLFGAGLFGLMVGAFIFGPLADKIGRKYSLILTVIFFGGASLASAWSTSITELTILRFLTGMGLGGAMPNAITLTSEFCPEKRRSFLTTLMFCGFTLGSAFGGLAAAQMVAGYGWESVLLLGGILPLALAPVLWLTLPESVRFLVLKNAPSEQITAVLHKIAPEADLRGASYTGVTKPKGSPVRQLFQPGLVSGTLLIWLSFFMSLLVFYLLSSWLPTVISSAGMTLKEAALMSMMLQLGGTAGALLIGALMDRINPHTVLGSFYALAALFIALIGSSTASPWLLSLAVFGTGFCLAGSQVGVNALAAGFYPTASRATGVAWANAVGRSGSVLGSMFGGAVLASGLGLPVAFAIVGIPAVIAGLSMFLKGRLAPQPVHHTAPGAYDGLSTAKVALQH
ncbi:MFS transporter [Skermanella aerolata]|jgi:AAHS family 4-hydroxybenzoate transporter-like MFS transporter|uniref:MFS transporter n=1 Tax=Skermanella aerolata TaxID=393310 RepID=A0A512E442_9PROT|nr:aromatic acid/H+ symport family MFS transporter [Skermanella aerolata]KJB90772.1 4-hydroxybenzoate transporter [Skermanella aerolata KACC 11604]GEO43506.1 MFS transporter [Skermanella aerolata]